MQVRPCSILPFALTCRKHYNFALPTLYRALAFTPATLLSFYNSQLASPHPSRWWIRDVELKFTRRERPVGTRASANEIAIMTSLITSLPTLTSLNTIPCYYWQIEGWSSFFSTLQVLPANMESLGVRFVCSMNLLGAQT